MPRPRYQLTADDVSTAQRWIWERVLKPGWPSGLPAGAYEQFPGPQEKTTPRKLQRWCDRYLDVAQWRKLQNVIRAARRDLSEHRTVRLSRNAHELLSRLAKRDRITLSEVIERYLAGVVNAPAPTHTTQTAETSPPKRMEIDEPATKPHVMKVELWLRVERNSKFVRGKKRAREEIEWQVLSQYQMEKPNKDRWEYILTIPYETDEELDRIIYDDILREAAWIADLRNCFIETDVRSLEDPERSW